MATPLTMRENVAQRNLGSGWSVHQHLEGAMAELLTCAPRILTRAKPAFSQPGFGWSDLSYIGALSLLLFFMSGCDRTSNYSVPPRSEDKVAPIKQVSAIGIPMVVSLDLLQADLNRKFPLKLWSIREHHKKCVPGQHVKIFKKALKITPDLGCDIIGEVTRGQIKLEGRGKDLMLTMPIQARVSARDVGGFLKGETATGAAIVRTRVSFSVSPTWHLIGTVSIDYDWAEPPGIDFLGQRIKFARLADKELQKVVRDLEEDFRKQISEIRLRQLVAESWAASFTTVELNHANPPVWLRVTPQSLALTGYQAAGRTLRLNMAATAITETFVGERPPANKPTPLPSPSTGAKASGLQFHIPVVSSYAELEPVILRALRKLNAKGIRIRDIGRIEADFKRITLYGTTGKRLAVGIEADVELIGQKRGKHFAKTKGEIWLTGTPVHDPNSQIVRIRNLEVYANTDRVTADLLFTMVNSPEFREELARNLTQDFSKDYNKVVVAARKAISERRLGVITLQADIDKVEHGLVTPLGQGLYMPVEVRGSGKLILKGGD